MLHTASHELSSLHSLVAQLVKNPPAMQETPVRLLVRKIPWRRDRLPTPVFLGFPGSSDGKQSACNAGDLGSIPELGSSPGGGHGNPLQSSCLETPHGQRRLVGYCLWGCKELDTTEKLCRAQCIHVNATLSIHPPHPSPLCPQVRSLHLHLCSCPLLKIFKNTFEFCILLLIASAYVLILKLCFYPKLPGRLIVRKMPQYVFDASTYTSSQGYGICALFHNV